MFITAFLCIFIGVYPQALYDILPYPVDFVPYTTAHVITQLQLLMFSALAFTFLMLYHIYPPELKSTNLDTEWFYRRLLPRVLNRLRGWIDRADQAIRKESLVIIGDVIAMIERNHGPESAMSRTILAGSMALVVITVLLLFLVVVII